MSPTSKEIIEKIENKTIDKKMTLEDYKTYKENMSKDITYTEDDYINTIEELNAELKSSKTETQSLKRYMTDKDATISKYKTISLSILIIVLIVFLSSMLVIMLKKYKEKIRGELLEELKNENAIRKEEK